MLGHHLLLQNPVFLDGLDQPDPPHLQSLLQEADLLLLLLAVVLDVLPQAAGVRVPLLAAHHLALVRLLEGGMKIRSDQKTEIWRLTGSM